MDINELEKLGLIDEFNLEEDEVFEARYNLLGFYETLYKIKARLEAEKGVEVGKEGVKND